MKSFELIQEEDQHDFFVNFSATLKSFSVNIFEKWVLNCKQLCHSRPNSEENKIANVELSINVLKTSN